MDTDIIWFKNPDKLFDAPLYKEAGGTCYIYVCVYLIEQVSTLAKQKYVLYKTSKHTLSILWCD